MFVTCVSLILFTWGFLSIKYNDVISMEIMACLVDAINIFWQRKKAKSNLCKNWFLGARKARFSSGDPWGIFSCKKSYNKVDCKIWFMWILSRFYTFWVNNKEIFIIYSILISWQIILNFTSLCYKIHFQSYFYAWTINFIIFILVTMYIHSFILMLCCIKKM